MSGIVGVLNLDGAPVDRAYLRRMTALLAFRGPDAQAVWVHGNVGFGHALLRTTDESINERQPLTLDDRTWIVADARVDDRKTLIEKLGDHGENVAAGAPDVELLLRSYRVWGEGCLDHVIGDFSFAIWDGSRKRLFCARDHLGVKPFYFAEVGQTLVFSNTPECIREYPAVSDELNDQAIADFLIHNFNQNPATTSFKDIQRLLPAHYAIWSAHVKSHSTRYWTLPVDEPVYFKRAEEYTDRFTELLDTAVADRLRTNRVAILMSGGMDSSTLAATSCKLLRGKSGSGEVHAFTTVNDGLDQNEKHYAGLVAEHLGIPIHLRENGPDLIDPEWDTRLLTTSEPLLNPSNLQGDRREFQEIAETSRVLFFGEGPDNALRYEWKTYLSWLIRNRHFTRMACDLVTHVVSHQRVPLLPTIPRFLRKHIGRLPEPPDYPEWLNPEFERRLGLLERWDEHERSSTLPAPRVHPVRPIGYSSMLNPLWDVTLRHFDPPATRVPVETRHPFLDLRLLRYMLAVPCIPWCRVKYLERRAMRGFLPDAVLRRSKAPLTGDPPWVGMRKLGFTKPKLSPMSLTYIDWERVPEDVGADMMMFRINFRAWALNYWLKDLRRKPLRLFNGFEEELKNEFVRTT